MMNITCLVTTYKLKPIQVYSLLENMNLFCRTILRNQTDYDSFEQKVINGHEVTIINARDIGLSVNRNELLKLVGSEYIIFADDDETFYDDTLEIIERAFLKKDADAFAFNFKVLNTQRGYKEYHGNIKRCSKKSLMSTGIYRLVFKTNSIRNLVFDEKIGSGSPFLCGEDSVFISDFFRRTKKCYFCEDYICVVSQENSLWIDKINTDNYLYAKGYVYKKIYHCFYFLVCLYSLFKMRKFSLKNYFKMISGTRIIHNYYKNATLR